MDYVEHLKSSLILPSLYGFLLIFCLVTCTDGERNGLEDCIEMQQSSSFNIEQFKDGYSIQFPTGYTGDGLNIHQSGVNFHKFSPDSISYFYEFSNDFNERLYFGDTLLYPLPKEIINPMWEPWQQLDLRMDFCTKDELVAVLYYSSETDSYAKLYIRYQDVFRDALTIIFKNDQLEEITAVIRTIREF